MKTHNTYISNKRIAAQKGAGLSFALAGFLLFSTGNWLFLLLVPVGALAGLAIDFLLVRFPAVGQRMGHINERASKFGRAIIERFEDDRLVVRFGLLFILAVIIFVGTWSLSYHLLPEGLLSRGSEVRMMGNEEVATNLWREIGFMIIRNLPWVFVIALINWLVGYPFASLIPLSWVVFYAVILGTNSFTVPLAERMAPSLEVLNRAGPYEISAFLFAVASTFPLSRISLPWRKMEKDAAVNWLTVVIGLLLSCTGIVLAAWREASMLLGR